MHLKIRRKKNDRIIINLYCSLQFLCDTKSMTYKINLTMEFRTRPTKRDVEDKLFNLLRDGFSLQRKEEYERKGEPPLQKI